MVVAIGAVYAARADRGAHDRDRLFALQSQHGLVELVLTRKVKRSGVTPMIANELT